ncbi:hypothetical protein HanRHA438_Chr14g0630811 [Helianthus annuus]|uniref:Uncharacterized protein n=2 Tax=Helianthus annuus TaxID=4232 RepID=A0A251VDX9_HELAN|nr:hypothetical protein HanXRQr2_Chr10g0434811 [Helianthus annuus]KAF5803919.1 hypothetical protein HanXRQr2_Chr06g0277091 [Helianthus annuus]KAJ0815362.1 hypothetical protein HanPSC8_Chr17g0796631 [Helianthus annuus]KAJ0851777.1 hypothetical protein HanRHA438_Chr14g0630811 [Helianthus annuus]KAJ0916965.1 hypothetical protein HanPSC8_Chr06g0267921 [Helianthus annuus]
MFEGRNLRFTKDFLMCFVMNRLRFVKRLTDVRRTKSEVYEGFSHVFCDESTQNKLTPIFWLPEKVYLLGESRNWLWRR